MVLGDEEGSKNSKDPLRVLSFKICGKESSTFFRSHTENLRGGDDISFTCYNNQCSRPVCSFYARMRVDDVFLPRTGEASSIYTRLKTWSKGLSDRSKASPYMIPSM